MGDLASDMKHEVFVIGCPRSGTTAVAQALRNIGYAGVPGEGHVLTLLPLIRKVIGDYRQSKSKAHADDAVAQFSFDGFQDAADAYMRDFFAGLFDGRLFVDKTPYDAIEYPVADIRRIWPNARILYCLRNGINNVNSQLRKFGGAGVTFGIACMNWAGGIRNWLNVAEAVADIAMVVKHEELLEDPLEMAKRIGGFLHLDEAESAALAKGLVSDFPEFTGAGSQLLTWSEEELRIFAQVCGPWMKRVGYELPDQFSAATRCGVQVLTMEPLLNSAQPSMVNPKMLQVQDRELSLHPPLPGGETRLTFPKLPLANSRQFITYVKVRNTVSEPVRFQLEVSPVAGKGETFRQEIDVNGGDERPWSVPLPDDMDCADVALITSMSPGARHNQFAWSVFCNPRIV
jgi:hypothetical protein